MSFGNDIDRIRAKVHKRHRDMLVGCAQLCHESIQVGSEITGAPGQPVDIGTLRGSWQLSFPDAISALITTNLVYAKPIEDGIQTIYLGDGKHTFRSPIHFRSAVGGSHSVKLTIAAFESRIVPHVAAKVIN